MSGAVVFLFIPAVILLVVGAAVLVWAIRGIRRSRAIAILRILAGVGILACIALAVGPFYLDLPYGVFILPVMSLIAAVVWAVPLLTAAAIVSRSRPRG